MTAPKLPSLGTPLSPTATRVMLLGAGELGKEVLMAYDADVETARKRAKEAAGKVKPRLG